MIKDDIGGTPAQPGDGRRLERLAASPRYSKFGVHNRAALISLWLGRFPEGG